MLDTETTNTLIDESGKLDMSCTLVYDIGFQVIDYKGNVYESGSYINEDIFRFRADLMDTCYYANKIPQYWQGIADGTRTMLPLLQIRGTILALMEQYDITAVVAHNARFDKNALNKTIRFQTQSQIRYFFPFDTEWWDTMKMAADVICPKPSYYRFCKRNGFMTTHKNPRPRRTAEALYCFISQNPDFVENHTGLEDVKIETEIFVYCVRQRHKMRKRLYENGIDFPKPTYYQMNLHKSIKRKPQINYKKLLTK